MCIRNRYVGTFRSAIDRLRWAQRSLRETVDNVKEPPLFVLNRGKGEKAAWKVNVTMVEQAGVEVWLVRRYHRAKSHRIHFDSTHRNLRVSYHARTTIR